jgi:scyllo-inositol 2-dehydrogenase (NADP+)
MIRTGLIGRGMAGTVFHAPLIRAAEGLELSATAGSADAADLIASPAIDLVVIATPNESHAPLARAALEAGKHVVIDKPFALYSGEADELIDLARARGRMLTVFHNRRWDGDFLTVKKVLGEGALGDLALYEAHWDRFRPAIKHGWREVPAHGAGVLWDLAPHLIDQAVELFGVPDSIAADIAVQRPAAAVDDYFHLTFHYGSMRAILGASTLAAAPRPRFALHGSAGSFVKHGLDPQEAALKEGADPRDSGFGEDPVHGLLTLPEETRPVRTEKGRYLTFYETAAAACRGEAPPPVDPAEARTVIALLEFARASAQLGARLVPSL